MGRPAVLLLIAIVALSVGALIAFLGLRQSPQTAVVPSPTARLTLLATPSPTARPTASPTPSPTASPTPSPTPRPTPTPSPPPTPAPTPPPTPAPTPSPTEGPEFHTNPDLEALLPDSVAGIALHRTSPSIAAQIQADPRAQQALTLLRFIGKSANDIHFARAEDRAGPGRITILAFQVQGIDARAFGGAVVGVVLSAVPGATTSNVTLAGKPVIKATPPSGGLLTYVYEKGDIAFSIQTTDENLAVEALAKLP